MSVFKTLKGTLQNVQQDIVDGFRALTSLDTLPRHERLKQLVLEGINLDVGADLLYRYQKNWAEIQSYTTDSAKQAEEVDALLSKVFVSCDQRCELLTRFQQEAAELPSIVTSLDNITELIISLQKDFQTVEEELDVLENLCEELTLEHEKTLHMAQLASYRKSKETQTLNLKGKLWASLKDKAKEVEKRQSRTQLERQDVFENAFNNDLDYYRTHGHPHRLSSGTEFPKVTSLSDITIEEDSQALNEFLSSGEETAHSQGGSFIEDDYTADYAVRMDDDIPELDMNQTINFDDTVLPADHQQSLLPVDTLDAAGQVIIVDTLSDVGDVTIVDTDLAQEAIETEVVVLEIKETDCNEEVKEENS